jgi:hypothetical protein
MAAILRGYAGLGFVQALHNTVYLNMAEWCSALGIETETWDEL